jgi:hypothetical protein
MRPFEYGGRIWYKFDPMTDWASDGDLVANNQGFNGAEYSGNQLGTPDFPMKFRGNTYCHAHAGTGTDKRIIMSYMYNPNPSSYTIGISYSSPGTVYTNASTVVLNY